MRPWPPLPPNLQQLTGWDGAQPKQPAPDGERRRAAVLVSVIADYSTLIEQLAPAAFRELIARIRSTATEIMRKHGGLVNQSDRR